MSTWSILTLSTNWVTSKISIKPNFKKTIYPIYLSVESEIHENAFQMPSQIWSSQYYAHSCALTIVVDYSPICVFRLFPKDPFNVKTIHFTIIAFLVQNCNFNKNWNSLYLKPAIFIFDNCFEFELRWYNIKVFY